MILIVDNYRSHTANKVDEWLAQQNRLRLFYLPILELSEDIWACRYFIASLLGYSPYKDLLKHPQKPEPLFAFLMECENDKSNASQIE